LTYIKEFSGVCVAIVNPDRSTTNSNIQSDSEITGLEWHLGAVLLNNDVSLEESTLRSSTVDHLGFSNHDRPIFEEVVDNKFPDAIVLQSRFNNTFLEVAEESEHLFVQLHKGRLI
jgi:hypothetical protein